MEPNFTKKDTKQQPVREKLAATLSILVTPSAIFICFPKMHHATRDKPAHPICQTYWESYRKSALRVSEKMKQEIICYEIPIDPTTNKIGYNNNKNITQIFKRQYLTLSMTVIKENNFINEIINLQLNLRPGR